MVQYHTRHGIRKDCVCDYCLMKWQATIQIGGFSNRRFWDRESPHFVYQQQPYALPPSDDINEAFQNYVRQWRNFHRKKFRERLDELKEE